MIIILLLIILIVSIVVVVSFRNDRILVAFQDDGVCFDMSVQEIKKIKGEPYKIQELSETPFISYYFNDEISGYSVDSKYTFSNGFFVDRLNMVYIKIYIDDPDEARRMFNDFNKRLTQYYQTQEDYFHEDVEEVSAKEFRVKLGTNDGATGIRIEIEYKDGILKIDSIYQR